MEPPRLLWPFAHPVVAGTFVARSKRFFVGMMVGGQLVRGHTANTGAMTGLLVPGSPVLCTRHPIRADGGTRALALELEAIGLQDGGWCGVNTILANRTAEAALRLGLVPSLAPAANVTTDTSADPIRREVRVGDSRLDLLVQTKEGPTHVEVKAVTLRIGDIACFPDAPTERGRKHLRTLTALAKSGQRAAMLFLVPRTDTVAFAPARAVDPAYANALQEAAAAGVVVEAVSVAPTPQGFLPGVRLPITELR